MVRIDITHDLKKITKQLDDLQKKQIPYATSIALNDMAFAVQKDIKKEMDEKFDRPIPFTQRAFKVKKATKRNLTAVVYLQKNRSYMDVQFEGGEQRPKRLYLTTPVHKSVLNKKGNLRRGTLRRRLAGPKTFAGEVKGRPKAPVGIYQRTGRKGRGGLRLLAVYTTKRNYTKRIDLGDINFKRHKKSFGKSFNRAMSYAIRTAR